MDYKLYEEQIKKLIDAVREVCEAFRELANSIVGISTESQELSIIFSSWQDDFHYRDSRGRCINPAVLIQSKAQKDYLRDCKYEVKHLFSIKNNKKRGLRYRSKSREAI